MRLASGDMNTRFKLSRQLLLLLRRFVAIQCSMFFGLLPLSEPSMSWRWLMMIFGVAVCGIAGCFGDATGPAGKRPVASKPTPTPTAATVTTIHLDSRTSDSGVQFQYRNDEERGHFAILESMGGGVALLDFDQDGLLDVLLPGGGRYGAEQAGGVDQILGVDSALFRNVGDWQFTNVTQPAHVRLSAHYSHGVAVADMNEDGFPDVLVTGYGGATLYRNQGDGSFVDATPGSGLTDTLWSTSAAWGDLNGDGFQDLYIAHYVDWSFDNHPLCPGPGDHPREVCPPRRFEPLPDIVYFGRGDGTFEDGTVAAGLQPDGKGIGVVLADIDLDSDLDIYVANDTVANFLYRNDGRGHFEDISMLSGTALSDRGLPDGSMGTDVGDFNSDGLPDIWVANYEHETFGLYRNLGQGLFRHVSQSMGVTAVGSGHVGWGTRFLDLDMDGDEDLFVSNGHVIRFPANTPLRQRPLVFENVDGRRYVNVADSAGDYTASAHLGRGLATGDLDEDGDEDIVLSNLNEPVELLASESLKRGHSLVVRVIGRESCRTAIGAVAVATVRGRKLMRQIRGGSSYASSSDTRLFFGCGDVQVVEELLVTWTSGQTIRLTNIPCDQVVTVLEPKGE